MGFDPYREWLHISADGNPPNHYELLGVPVFERSGKLLHEAYRRRHAVLRQYEVGKRQGDALRLMDEIRSRFSNVRN